MNKIIFRKPEEQEIPKVGKQVAAAYKAAYAEMMDEAYLSSLSEGHWVPILRESLRRGDVCMVAEKDGRILGTAVFGKTGENLDGVMLHALYLCSDWIGKGVGSLFYSKIEKEIVAQGVSFCSLEVLSANRRAIRFYLSHGFRKTDVFTVDENGMTLSCDKMIKKFN